MYSVADLMTQDVTPVGADEPLSAAQRLWGRASQKYLPVIDGGRPIGMLARTAALAAVSGSAGTGKVLTVRDVMTPQTAQVRPGTPLRNAANLMLRNESRCLAVVDEVGALVGILTDDELLRFALDMIADLDRLSDGLRRDAAHEEEALG